ncbi:helix-turn-helix domain-containing protein [Actinocrispum sp. NPDC049592]|uniref:TetR/AcrR family transcriptional regulator n=1 Tax=Actinocrispum sp. NPDC049592 TaxID=3154835 RepID=UPI003419B1CE
MVQRLGRVERREQILDAATRAFARSGYAGTGLDDVAAEAGITRVLLYRHFDSKKDLYLAVLGRAMLRLSETMGPGTYDEHTIPSLLRAASADPNGFRLVFRHAAREPEFGELVDSMTTRSREVAFSYMTEIADPQWREWVAALLPVVTLEAVIAWLDAGEPPGGAERVNAAVQGVIRAALGS